MRRRGRGRARRGRGVLEGAGAGAPAVHDLVVGDDLAVAEGDDALGELGDVGVVGDEHDRPPLVVERLENRDDLLRGVRVEVAGRLVGEQDGRIVHQAAGDGDALLLAARQLRRGVVPALRQAHPLEAPARPRPAFGVGHVGLRRVEQRQLDVLEGVGARQQVEVLEHEADLVVADLGAAVAVEVRDLDAVEHVAAGGRPVETADDVHQRRLAGAGRTHDRHELAAVDVERDAVQGAHLRPAHAVDAVQVADADDRLRRVERLDRRLAGVARAGHGQNLGPREAPACEPGPAARAVCRPMTTGSPALRSLERTAV